MLVPLMLSAVLFLSVVCGVPGLESPVSPPPTHVTELTSLTYRDFVKSNQHVLVEV